MFNTSLNNPIKFLPDYSAGVSISTEGSGNYTAPIKGFLSCCFIAQNATANIYVNNNLVSRQASGGAFLTLDTQLLVSKNDIISWENVFSGGTIIFFPLKKDN